jgi:ATP-dependent DNA helicase RecG
MDEPTIRSGMPFNLDDLIHRRAIEGNRVEFKATWNHPIESAVVKTVCAFANDLLNLNGGYIVLGVEEEGGRPILPPRGMDDLDLDEVQKEVYGACHRIRPDYQPILFPGDYQGKAILVIWAPGGDTRPYQAAETKGAKSEYYVRQGPMSVVAKGEFFRQLMESAAKVPFDDRRSLQAKLEDISPTLVRRFLHQVRSDILNADPPFSDYELYRKLRIVLPINAHEVPRNVGLLFFHEDPDQFFSGARIEVVRFWDDAAGDRLQEWIFRGPLPEQILSTLNHLRSFGGGERVWKVKDQAEALRTFAYPFEAVEEALVNAVYHRGYDGPSEAVKVYIYPDRMEIINYPGPVAGVKREQLEAGQPGPIAPARNRRIGEFLKELRLAEARGTGIPKIRRIMKENGSPEPKFEFDDDRTYYRTTLLIHPRHFTLYNF